MNGCISDESLFVQDCHIIYNTKIEDIKNLKDKLLSNLIKTTKLWEMIFTDTINLENIYDAVKTDLQLDYFTDNYKKLSKFSYIDYEYMGP